MIDDYIDTILRAVTILENKLVAVEEQLYHTQSN